MIDITTEARSAIKMNMQGMEAQPVRIFLMQSCGGPPFGLMPDEKKLTDTLFTVDNQEYIIDTSLYSQASPIKIFTDDDGLLQVDSPMKVSPQCHGCSSAADGNCSIDAENP